MSNVRNFYFYLFIFISSEFVKMTNYDWSNIAFIRTTDFFVYQEYILSYFCVHYILNY
jgi:hypothetical protein